MSERDLTHLDESGSARMVNIGEKPETLRRLVAITGATPAPRLGCG